MLAKLIALLNGTSPESREFDYTRQHWGHALHFVRGFKPKGKMEITGHFFGAGLIHERKPCRQYGNRYDLTKVCNGRYCREVVKRMFEVWCHSRGLSVA